ncbi:MAG: hypothetical protein RJA70_5007, partial [Pseudomonadota bacterium]
MTKPVIRVSELVAGYPGVTLLERISFEVAQQDIFVILGGSGCGKSTLLRHLVGLEAPLGGHIDINGKGGPTLTDGPPQYGVAFQAGALFSSMTT